MTPCRDCNNPVSQDAYICPKCGAPKPADHKWDGWGYEFKSETEFYDWPLLHISFKYKNSRPVPARGIIAIGQFGIGIVSISQFGIGVFSLSQFTVSLFALGQFVLAYSGIAQIGLMVDQGYGQMIYYLTDLIK